MICKRVRAAKLVIGCLACIAPQPAILTAQETSGPPRYIQAKLSDGAVQFTDSEMGVSFTLPRDWTFGNHGVRIMDRGWKSNLEGDIATIVLLHHRQTGEDIWLYYVNPRHPDSMAPDATDKWLLAEVDDKTSQRRAQQRLKNYHVRPSSYEPQEIGGKRALSWVAEFTQGNTNMAENIVMVRSNRTLVEFSVRCPATSLDTVRRHAGPIIRSLTLR